VRVIILDFSKAFDTIRHSTLFEKFSQLDMPDCVHNWLVDFFTDRNHCTKFGGKQSSTAAITSSVVQGSAVGPASFAVAVSDLPPLHAGNELLKFADDTYLIIPEDLSNTANSELSHIEHWSQANTLKLNKSKSYEIIFYRKHTSFNKKTSLPPLLDGISRVDSLKCLGVTLCADFTVTAHVQEVISRCAQSLFALRTLRAHGLCATLLETVFRSVTLSKLLYASPAWWGFASSTDKNQLEAFLRKAGRAGFYSQGTSFATLCNTADTNLFQSIMRNHNHVLNKFLPPKPSHNYDLRPRSHPFILPPKRNVLDEQNFLYRMLYATPSNN